MEQDPCGGLNENGSHRLIDLNARSQLVDLERTRRCGLVGKRCGFVGRGVSQMGSF